MITPDQKAKLESIQNQLAVLTDDLLHEQRPAEMPTHIVKLAQVLNQVIELLKELPTPYE